MRLPFAGKKVALMARSVTATTYDLQCDYLEYSTNTEILEAVEQGEADLRDLSRCSCHKDH